jgi:hypothetical protein
MLVYLRDNDVASALRASSASCSGKVCFASSSAGERTRNPRSEEFGKRGQFVEPWVWRHERR